MRGGLQFLAVAIPILVAARPVGERQEPPGPPRSDLPPVPHAVDVWGEHALGTGFDLAGTKQGLRSQLAAGPGKGLQLAELAPPPLGGFTLVGSVAVIEGDDALVGRVGTGFGIRPDNLAALSKRFIAAFGDNFDQIAVFLSFSDRNSATSLAYQQPIKSDIKGLGLTLYDSTAVFGSGGRMQTMLNMKRINVYGRDAAADPDNGLYAVWAQEAAHRWLVYLRYKFPGDTKNNDALLGRQTAHWARGVQADGSIMDGYHWVDNGDGTYTPTERGVRYGILDQYGMGLRTAAEVPPFFLLEDITDMTGTVLPPAPMGRIVKNARYTAKRIDITIEDIVRASGAREPSLDPAAPDLRMGVALLGPPGIPVEQLIGEAFAIDNTRRLWTDFYNEAGGGRGKVCTELFRPCRGEAFEFSELRLSEAAAVKDKDGVVAPGEAIDLEVKVTNLGSEAGKAKLHVNAGAALNLGNAAVESPALMPGASAVVKLGGRATRAVACSQPVIVDISAPGRLAPSRVLLRAVLGLAPVKVESFDGPDAPGWRVNPEGTDPGMAGRWALGPPQRTVAFDYTLQPGAAFSGQGAFVTGLAPEEVDNVEGKTTLESPPFALAGVREPTLSYQVYFVAADFAAEVLVPAPSGSLQVQASVDGKPFVEVDRVTGMATGWQRRLVRLSEKLGPAAAGAAVQLRFVAEEATQAARPVVEAVIDDVGIYGEVAACEGAGLPGAEPDAGVDGGGEPGGCGCRIGAGRAQGAASATLVIVGLALLVARGRRRR